MKASCKRRVNELYPVWNTVVPKEVPRLHLFVLFTLNLKMQGRYSKLKFRLGVVQRTISQPESTSLHKLKKISEPFDWAWLPIL